MLTAPGAWDVRVQTERAGEPNRSASLLGAVSVQSAFQGTDGRRYLLQTSSDPAAPVADQDFIFSVAFVDAVTGAALPEGVDIQTWPARQDGRIVLRLQAASPPRICSHRARRLRRLAHLFNAGSWTASVNFPSDGV